MATKITEYKWGSLMAGLVYPATLGSALVWFFQYTGTHFSNKNINGYLFLSYIGKAQTWFALWFIVYFCLAWIQMSFYDIGSKKYNASSFLIDMLEVLAIFFAFFNLGFVNSELGNFQMVYVAYFIVPLAPVLSYFHYEKKLFVNETTAVLSLYTWIISIIMFVVGYKNAELNWLAIGSFTYFLILYIHDYINRNNQDTTS